MNAWLSHFAHLLDLVREHKGREPTDGDRRLVFTFATDVDRVGTDG